jgi:hypothetical protein
MANQSEQAEKSTRELARNRHQTVVWIGVIVIAFVFVLGILLLNSKAFEIGGIGFLLLLVLLRVVPGVVEKQVDKKSKEEK